MPARRGAKNSIYTFGRGDIIGHMLNSPERHPFFYALLIGVSGGFAAMMLVFWQAILWAVVIGVLFRPVEARLSRRLHDRPSAAALLTELIIIITVLLPALLVASAVIAETAGFYARVQSGEIDLGALTRWFDQRLPDLRHWLSDIGIDLGDVSQKLSSAAVALSSRFASMALSTGHNVTAFLISCFMMLYLLFFILRDGDSLLQYLHRVIPLPDELERRLFDKFAEVARATVKGSLVIGLAQGTLGGLIFALLGLEGAVFWGVIMVILSVVPAVGAALVWAPAALFLFIGGSWIKGIILVLFGALVIGLLDNFLRPILVGRDTKMPDYVILFSTLGGLSLFGMTGLVLGPVLAALCIAVWEIYTEEAESIGLPAVPVAADEGDDPPTGEQRQLP